MNHGEKSSDDQLEDEVNLFELQENDQFIDDDDDDDNDSLYQKDSSLDDIDDEEDDEEDNDEDNDKGSFLDDDEENEEDEEDDDEITEEELASLNKKLGTDFKDASELKKSLSSQDDLSEKEKEQKEYKVLTNRIDLYDKFISMDNETLVRNQLISQASNAKKDIEDQDVIDEIEEKIEGLKDLEQLDSFAETLRSNLQTQKDKTQVSIDKIEAKSQEEEAAIAKKNVNELQDAFAQIYLAKEFMGVTVNKEDIQDAYNSIRNNKFFESVNGNQEMIAKLALFVKYEKEISKVAKQPTHSDKTKGAFDFLSSQDKKQRRSIAQANGSASSGNVQENLSNWLK